jgi:hypothetical protein
MYLNNFNQVGFFFSVEVELVSYVVETVFLYIMNMNFRLQRFSCCHFLP